MWCNSIFWHLFKIFPRYNKITNRGEMVTLHKNHFWDSFWMFREILANLRYNYLQTDLSRFFTLNSVSDTSFTILHDVLIYDINFFVHSSKRMRAHFYWNIISRIWSSSRTLDRLQVGIKEMEYKENSFGWIAFR